MAFDLPPPNPAPGLLIVEGDAERLRCEGHATISDMLERGLTSQVQAGRLRLRRQPIRDARELAQAKALAHWSTYDAALVLAHGSPVGVTAAPRTHMLWPDVAAALAPTKPRHLLLVACFGGFVTATEALFNGIPSLNRIVGSPGPLTVRQAQLATFELVAAAYGHEVSLDASAAGNVFNAALTRGLLFTRTREGRELTPPGERLLQDLLSLGIWSMLGSTSRRRDVEERQR